MKYSNEPRQNKSLDKHACQIRKNQVRWNDTRNGWNDKRLANKAEEIRLQ